MKFSYEIEFADNEVDPRKANALGLEVAKAATHVLEADFTNRVQIQLIMSKKKRSYRKCSKCQIAGHMYKDCPVRVNPVRYQPTPDPRPVSDPPEKHREPWVSPLSLLPEVVAEKINEDSIEEAAILLWDIIEYKDFPDTASVLDGDIEIVEVRDKRPICQLTLEPLVRPVIGSECDHNKHFFELSSLLKYWKTCHAAKRKNWEKCSHCKKKMSPNALCRSEVMEAVVESLKNLQIPDKPHDPEEWV